jgi:acetyl esterase/lipase
MPSGPESGAKTSDASGLPPLDDSRTRRSPLTIAQHATVITTRLVFGALCGTIRIFRGAHPKDWRTIRYGLHREEILDYHAPPADKPPHRAVVFIHGGGWLMGTKDFYAHDLTFLPEAGYPVFNIEYPKAPEHPHPRPLRSLLAALVFIKRSFPEATHVHLMGDSAGGNLAVMAALLLSDVRLLKQVDPWCDPKKLPKVLSVTSIYGVLDRATMLRPNVPGGAALLAAYAGQDALKEAVGPEHSITPMDLKFERHPPCFIACGGDDPILPSSQIYAERLQKEGHRVVLTTYPKAFHGFFNFPEGEPKRNLRRDIVTFLNENFLGMQSR